MAIDPRIALGVQPMQIQQPNMLAQYAQIMGIRAAQQEMEGNEGVRGALSQGAPEDPTKLLQYGKQGRATYESLLKGRKEQLESNQKRIDMMGGLAGFVRERPTPENFQSTLDQAVSYGLMTPAQRQDTLAKYGGSPESIKAYADQTFQSALTAKDRTANETRLQAANIGAGPGYMNARLAREQYDDKLKYGGDLVTTTIPNPENPKERIEIQTRRPLRGDQLIPLEVAPMPMRVDISPSSATSAYQPPSVEGGGTPNVLATQVAPQGGGAAAPIVNALNPNAPQGPTFAQPKPTFRAPVPVMIDNKAVLVPADKAIGMTPATAFTEKQAAGKTETVRSLSTAISNLTDAIKPGGLLEKSTGSGFGRMVDASAAFVGKATEGAKAAASLAPIADLVLKMVPRFEGPQSDKDTQSYKEAAGQLADSGLPNETRKDAAKVILRLMKERKDQFGMSDQVGGSGAGGGAPADPLGIR
jgi:hypothetical protein